MSRARALGIAAAIVLLLVGLVFQQDSRRLSPTSYGTVAGGHRALFELLGALGLVVERSFEPPGELGPGTVWWIEPRGRFGMLTTKRLGSSCSVCSATSPKPPGFERT